MDARQPVSDRVARLVEARLPDVPTVGALAAQLGLDRSTLYRHLRAEGTTPSGVVRRVRLACAAARLSAGAAVEAAAGEAGYAEVASFSRAFRHAYGVPPSAWAARRPSSPHT